MRHLTFLWLPALAAALTMSSPLRGQQQDGAESVSGTLDQQAGETLGYDVDRHMRMTVPVDISGNGPYHFLVDTGSERTVISRELAADLALEAGPVAVVHSMTEVNRIRTVIVPALRLGQRTMDDIHAPAFARADMGAAGILGVDTLQSQRVVFDFRRQQMTISPSRRADPRWPADTIVVIARNRFGRLMLVDASIDGQRVHVIVDTGAAVTMGNSALRRRLERRGRLGPTLPIELISVTGGRFQADYGVARNIQIGGVTIHNLPIAFADVHPFRQLQLMDRPAILLGMDALQLFERVSVDFANRRVRLLPPASSEVAPTTRMALTPMLPLGS